MPHIFEHKCNKCDLSLPTGWGYQFYVANDKGERIICLHPSERPAAEEFLGQEPSLRLVFERTGFMSECICRDCLHQFRADFGSTCYYWHPYQMRVGFKHHLLTKARDKRGCPKCESTKVGTTLEVVGRRCPKCNQGMVKRIDTGAVS